MLICRADEHKYDQWRVLYMGSTASNQGPEEWWRTKTRVKQPVLDLMSLEIGVWEAPR